MKRPRTSERRRQRAWASFDDMAAKASTAAADARKARKASKQSKPMKLPPRAIPGDDED
jgi:hypothetical protein